MEQRGKPLAVSMAVKTISINLSKTPSYKPDIKLCDPFPFESSRVLLFSIPLLEEQVIRLTKQGKNLNMEVRNLKLKLKKEDDSISGLQQNLARVEIVSSETAFIVCSYSTFRNSGLS